MDYFSHYISSTSTCMKQSDLDSDPYKNDYLKKHKYNMTEKNW